MSVALEDLSVGDRVWCLFGVGTPYEVASVDRGRRELIVEPEPRLGGGMRPVTVPDSGLWLVTKQHWDQVWYWPDRAGETHETVVERFSAQHAPGDLVTGQFYDDGMPFGPQGYVTPTPQASMTFRIHANPMPFPRVLVEPIVDIDGQVVSAGPVVPLRVAMRSYRWALSFGELIVNWHDFLQHDA